MVSALRPFLFSASVLPLLCCCVLRALSLDCQRNELECSDGRNCTHLISRCDGRPQCEDGSDEEGCAAHRCTHGDHRCSDGKCVRATALCDGWEDCRDRTDEKGCVHSPSDCMLNEFRCFQNDKKCIRAQYRCDGDKDCPDGSDELDCDRIPCRQGEHRCAEGRCLPPSMVCDGFTSCKDGSDENDCGFEDIETVFYNEGPAIYMRVRTRSGFENTRFLPGSFANATLTGLSYDEQRRTLYISEAGRPALYAVKVQSSRRRVLVSEGLGFPVDLAFDGRSDNLYWLDSGKGTAEVVNVVTLRRALLIHRGLPHPIALALAPRTGTMFIASSGPLPYVFACGMDGKNRRILQSVLGAPLSLALHPSDTLLFWSDAREGTIAYVNYSSSREEDYRLPDYLSSGGRRIVERGVRGAMSVAVNERTVLHTADSEGRPTPLPGHEKEEGWKCLTFGLQYAEKSECVEENGGCEHLCLTSEQGRSCACPPHKALAQDGTSCS